jgi:hypothetical protein
MRLRVVQAALFRARSEDPATPPDRLTGGAKGRGGESFLSVYATRRMR